MDHWFSSLAAQNSLSPSAKRDLLRHGFVVIPGPVPQSSLVNLADCYDQAVLSAASTDVSVGRSTTRVSGFVNGSEAFDHLYIYPPVLEACCRVMKQPFKLSTMHARTLRPHTAAQELHVDFPSSGDGWPMVGFILMVDEFRTDNGATCFIPGSQGQSTLPSGAGSIVRACGPAGSMIVFNGSVWHGHGSNETSEPRRSIQGAYIGRAESSSAAPAARMRPETVARIGPLAKYLLAL
jgi:hypothetical protein